MIRIAVIDDQRLFSEVLETMIRSTEGYTCSHRCNSGQEFLDAIKTENAILPDIVLLDLEMPGMTGIELNTILQEQYPDIKVIILSVYANEKLIASLIRQGADGYLTKNCEKEELLNAVQMVFTNGYYINKMTLQAIQQNTAKKVSSLHNLNGIPIELTKREIEILLLICKELNNAEIAEQLYISQRTVEGHRNNMIHKIGCRNTAGLVLFGVRHNIYKLPF